MGRGAELSDFQRGTVVGCHMCKKSSREIASMLNLPPSTVSNVIVKWKRERITTTLPRCGRPQKLREEHRQVLERVALETCLPSVKAITAEFQAASGAQVSSRTVRRELHEMGFRGRVSTYRKSAGGQKLLQKQEAASQEEAKVDVSRLNLRIGRIIKAVQFPDSESLYIKHVDVGDGVFRTVVSEIPQHIPVDQMQNRMVVVLCNLKPVSTRGVESQALLLCARSSDKMEILDPPSGAVPGDRVIFLEFPGEPDMELKQTVWEQLQKDLRTNSQCVATYRGAAFEVEGKGVCTVQTLSDGEIK